MQFCHCAHMASPETKQLQTCVTLSTFPTKRGIESSSPHLSSSLTTALQPSPFRNNSPGPRSWWDLFHQRQAQTSECDNCFALNKQSNWEWMADIGGGVCCLLLLHVGLQWLLRQTVFYMPYIYLTILYSIVLSYPRLTAMLRHWGSNGNTRPSILVYCLYIWTTISLLG